MKMFAKDVRPAATPSIGTGNASARADAPSRASVPATVEGLGPPVAKTATAIAKTPSPARLTGNVNRGASLGHLSLEPSSLNRGFPAARFSVLCLAKADVIVSSGDAAMRHLVKVQCTDYRQSVPDIEPRVR